MSDFYRDDLDGTGTLSGRTPDVGSAPTAPDVDFADGSYIQAAADALLTSVILDGTGAAQVDNTICTSENLIIKLPTPPGADFFVEMVIRVTPTADSAYIGVVGRTSPEASNPPDGVNFVGGYFYINGTSSIGLKTWVSLEGTSTSPTVATAARPYYTGLHNITFRIEFEGAFVRFVVDGRVIYTYAIVDAEFLAAGEAYLFFDFDTFTANLTDLKILSIRAGSMPESSGDFWTAFVKTTERAG